MQSGTGSGLVGRDESLATLAACLDRAATGVPRFALVSGEMGVGKTRLVRELVRRQRPIVLSGTCVPVAGDGLAFAPLTQGLRRVMRVDRVRRLVEALPDLSRLLPAEGGEGAPTPAPLPAGDSHLRLFQSVLLLLARLGHERPTLMVVEDAHWADRSTRDLLTFLATNLTDEHVVLLVTYRDDAVVGDLDRQAWLSGLARLPRTERIRLNRLGPGDTARLVESLPHHPGDPDDIARIVARSDGNPLFVEHLVATSAQPDSGDTLPETLTELLATRIGALPEETRDLLRGAAVIGRSSSPELLAEVLAEDVVVVERGLRPAVRQHVLRVDAGRDTVTFDHPAFREVVYAELLPSERKRLHRRTASALQATSSPSPRTVTGAVGEIARHLYLAEDWPRALDALIEAGEQAERMYAFPEARDDYVKAYQLLSRVPSAADRIDPVELLSRASQAASVIGDDEEAITLVRSAIEQASDPLRRAALWERLGTYHYTAGRGQESEAALRQALALLPPDDASVLAARIHSGLALFWAVWGRSDDAAAAGQTAVRLAHSTGARGEEGRARNALGIVAAARGDLAEGISLLEEALAIAVERQDATEMFSAYVNLSHWLGVAGHTDDQVRTCREGIDALTRVGHARQGGTLLMANACETLLRIGRLQEARELAERALRLAPRGIMAAPVLIRAAQLACLAGEYDVAAEHCRQARAVVEAENAPAAWTREVAEVAADVELWAGRPDTAYTLALPALTVLRGTDEESMGLVLVASCWRALADLRETRRGASEQRSQAQLAQELEERSPSVLSPDAAEAAVVDGERARFEGDRAAAASAWREAVRLGVDRARPVQAAYARWRLAEAVLGMPETGAEGIAVLREAYDAAAALPSPPLVEEIRSLARWYRIDLIEVAATPSPEETATGSPSGAPEPTFGLTARELEVLRGLAAGRSNSELAADLGMSVKTASVHVSNILRKLDVPSRREAARFAHRHGIRG